MKGSRAPRTGNPLRVLLTFTVVLVPALLVPPPPASTALEFFSFSRAPANPLPPGIELLILQHDEALLEAEVRVNPNGEPGRILWTRILITDSAGYPVRSRSAGMGIGKQAYRVGFPSPRFGRSYTVTAETLVKPSPQEPDRRLTATRPVIIVDDDVTPPAIVIEPAEAMERPDSWKIPFRWSVTDASGLQDVRVSLYRDGVWTLLSREERGSYLPVHPGTYRLAVWAEDADNDRPGDRLSAEKMSPLMIVYDDDDEPPVLDVRFPGRVSSGERYLPVQLLASDPSGVADIGLVYAGELYEPPTGDVYAAGDFTTTHPLAFRLARSDIHGPGATDPWTFHPEDQGFRFSLQDNHTRGPAYFRFVFLSNPAVLPMPTDSALGHPGEAPYLSMDLSGASLHLAFQAQEGYPAHVPRPDPHTDGPHQPHSVRVLYRVNRGAWLTAFREEVSGRPTPLVPRSLDLPVRPNCEVQVKVVYEGEINAHDTGELKHLRVAGASVQTTVSYEVVEHEPVRLPVPSRPGVYAFTVHAADGDNDREGDASSSEEVYFFTVSDTPVSPPPGS